MESANLAQLADASTSESHVEASRPLGGIRQINDRGALQNAPYRSHSGAAL